MKYLNNVVEADHGKLKLLIRPVRGFKTLKTAYATIKGFEVMRALRKSQARVFALQERAIHLAPAHTTSSSQLFFVTMSRYVTGSVATACSSSR